MSFASGINEAVSSLKNGNALFGATPENPSDLGYLRGAEAGSTS